MADASAGAASGAGRPLHVWKFGGTSVANAERIGGVVRLVRGLPEGVRVVVVVSALGGVTDRLLEAIEQALARTGRHAEILEEIRERHRKAADELAAPDERERLRETIETLWKDLDELLHGVYLLRECTPRSRDAIISMGERISAPIAAAAFRAAGVDGVHFDASELIRTDATFGEANVDFAETRRLTRARLLDLPEGRVAVVTGFIASTEEGVVTTLGRSGSDYTATIIADALDAAEVIIWTDVDGVLSADPRLVPEAFSLDRLNYQEAAELAYFGAKVLHPRTMLPVQLRNIPLVIKNTMNPEAAGTLIASDTAYVEEQVKAVTSIRHMAVVTLEGSGMITSPGIAARALAALADEKINVLMISQGSSEQSICFVVRAAEQGRAVQALEEAFAVDRDRGDVSGVTSRGDVAAVAVVGENMRSRPGISGRMLSTLGRSRINVIAIAQGSSERNISVVVEDADAKRAVQALHEAFPLARRRAHLFVIGTGKMGGALLRLLEEQAPALLRNMSLNLRLVGLANSRRMVWDEEGLPFGDAPGRLDAGEPMDLDRVVQRLADGRLERLVLVDATASAEVARRYPELLEHNVAVVTPNKQANTLDLDFYLRLQQAKRRQRAPYFSETTVGAGLPVISALRDLLRVGDRVLRIEGVMSGTLSFVFDRLHHGVSFSEAVREAREKGYTEPDPREDLSGEDMARKMLILAREMGLQVESKDVRVESLVPKSLLNVPVGEFMERLHEVDAVWAERVAAHQAFGERLQHIGVIEAGQLAARVTPVRQDSPFYALRGADMMVTYTTERYGRTPLVVQGPGARIEITAAGLLADVIKAAELMS